MLRRPEPSARGPVGAPRCLGKGVCSRMPTFDVALLGSREDDHGGPVAGCVEHCNGLEDEVRSEEERARVWGVGADD
eukprot:14608265-Alexandrium_andersonii.AAC.1